MRRHSAGFTLIEALVALVILGGAGMALFTWINASIVSLRRVEDANARNDAMANAIEYMQAINPMATPTGRAELGAYAVEWTATAATPRVDGVGYPAGQSAFELALFDTRVRASRLGDSAWFEFQLTLVGYNKVRNAAPAGVM